jgi:hypothetical protein
MRIRRSERSSRKGRKTRDAVSTWTRLRAAGLAFAAMLFCGPASAYDPCTTWPMTYIADSGTPGVFCQLGPVVYNFNSTVVELARLPDGTINYASELSFQALTDRHVLSFRNLQYQSNVAFTYKVTNNSSITTGVTHTATTDGPPPPLWTRLQSTPSLPAWPSPTEIRFAYFWTPDMSDPDNLATLTAITHTLFFADIGRYWDSASVANGVVDGGPGVWNSSNENWTIETGSFNNAWPRSGTAIFAGLSGGLVTVDGTQIIGGLDFRNHDYTLQGGFLEL